MLDWLFRKTLWKAVAQRSASCMVLNSHYCSNLIPIYIKYYTNIKFKSSDIYNKIPESKPFHGTYKAVPGETADRKNTSRSRIKPDSMQLAVHHIQQCFHQKRTLNTPTSQAKQQHTQQYLMGKDLTRCFNLACINSSFWYLGFNSF